MRIGELINELKKYDPNREVWLEDSEYGLNEMMVQDVDERYVGRIVDDYRLDCNKDVVFVEKTVNKGDCVIYF